MKKALSLFLVVVMLLSCVPLSVRAEEEQKTPVPTITVESPFAAAGQTVDVDISISGNTGVFGAILTFRFPDSLILTGAKAGDAFANMDVSLPDSLTSPYTIFCDGVDVPATSDGVIITFTFLVAEDVTPNEKLAITASYSQGDVVDGNFEDLDLNIENGAVTIIDYIPGDVNGDGRVNTIDVTWIRRYRMGGYEDTLQNFNEAAADVNDDGRINTVDVTWIRRYRMGGFGVILKPSTPKCNHAMEKIPFKAATCEENGYPEYYHCAVCDKYYNDEKGTRELIEIPVIPATGHTAVTDPYEQPTIDKPGKTEGSHCSACGEILKAQEEIPYEYYTIEYHFADNDPYLQQQVKNGKLTNPNPAVYTADDSFNLQNLSVPGYNFEGWFDSQGANATQIKSISDQTGNLQLYAHWTKEVYKITFDTPDVDVYGTKITGETVLGYTEYTVDTGATLKNPKHFGYTFVGWSRDGKVLSSVPTGTIGSFTIHANWTSDRNKGVAVKTLGDPVIVEDMENGQYLFVYEIGTIQNVPLALIQNISNVESLELSDTYEFTQAVDKTFTDTIAQTLSKATTTTSSWTLSEDWNDSSSASNEHEEQIGKTKETVDSQGNVIEGKYYVSNVEGGSTSTTKSAGGSNETSSKITTGDSTGISGSYTRENETGTSVGVEAGISATASSEIGASAGPASAKAGYSVEASISASANVSQSEKKAATIGSERNVNFGTESGSSSESHWDTSNSSTSEWNTTQSYESAKSTSQNTEVSNAISEVIYDKYGYSSTIERGGENSKTQATDNSTASTKEYSSTVEYSVGETKSYSQQMNRTYNTPGWYRLVSAGTVHVFAVVGYDIATNSYFTYTYNVLDSERHIFVDYSKDDSTFQDCENAIIPFEVPYSVHEFVSAAMAQSSGLVVNEFGEVTQYTGSAEYVLIPEYSSATDGVSGPEAIKITSISASAFAGNTKIKGVYLPKYVGEIPASAFAGCTSLKTVIGYGISKVGANAFAGCVNLDTFNVDKYITELGDNSFKNVPEIKVMAANESVADSAINSGAKRITLDISGLNAYDNRVIKLPESTEYFAIAGNSAKGVTYKNLRIESDATETFISNMAFVENKNTPLTISSAKVTLSKTTVDKAPGFALIMTADNVDLGLYETVSLSSASENAVISKNVTLARANANIEGVLKLTGNYLVCGNITNNNLLTFVKGQTTQISATEFESMLTSSILTFNANGGATPVAEKLIYYGQPYGDLPMPTRTGYGFIGWYTAANGGEQVTADKVVSVLANLTLYAHWDAKAYNVSWNDAAGYSITVKRTSSPYANAATGTLSNGAVVYYGDVLSVDYSANTGYSISKKGATSITVSSNVTSSDIYATAKVNSYTVNWNTGTGYSIEVARTNSPYADATVGALKSGATVYYGDVLSVTYKRADYYTITSTGSDVITVTGNVTSAHIFATAKLNELSGWVKASELPSNATVENRKWTYDLTTKTESRETSLAGYTQTGSYWVQSGSGSFEYSDKFATYAPGFDTSNSIYKSLNKAPYTAYENQTSKRTVSNTWAGYVYWHWMYDCGGGGAANRAIYFKNATGTTSMTNNNYGYKYFGAFKSTTNFSGQTNANWAQNDTYYKWYHVTDRSSNSATQGSYWFYRFDYYICSYTDYYKMFQYSKTEAKESTTQVYASDSISNVQEWVQYRVK